jgi:hypothetical protein
MTITTPPKYFSQRSGIKAKFGRELYNNPTGRFLEILKFFKVKVIVGV